MEIKDIIGKKVAIWCDTEEKASDCVNRMNVFFEDGLFNDNFEDGLFNDNCFDTYKKDTCYNIEENQWSFCEKKWYLENEWEIISYNDFFGITEQVKDDAESEMSTVE